MSHQAINFAGKELEACATSYYNLHYFNCSCRGCFVTLFGAKNFCDTVYWGGRKHFKEPIWDDPTFQTAVADAVKAYALTDSGKAVMKYRLGSLPSNPVLAPSSSSSISQGAARPAPSSIEVPVSSSSLVGLSYEILVPTGKAVTEHRSSGKLFASSAPEEQQRVLQWVQDAERLGYYKEELNPTQISFVIQRRGDWGLGATLSSTEYYMTTRMRSTSFPDRFTSRTSSGGKFHSDVFHDTLEACAWTSFGAYSKFLSKKQLMDLFSAGYTPPPLDFHPEALAKERKRIESLSPSTTMRNNDMEYAECRGEKSEDEDDMDEGLVFGGLAINQQTDAVKVLLSTMPELLDIQCVRPPPSTTIFPKVTTNRVPFAPRKSPPVRQFNSSNTASGSKSKPVFQLGDLAYGMQTNQMETISPTAGGATLRVWNPPIARFQIYAFEGLMIKMIDEAQYGSHIHMSVYALSSHPIMEALLQAVRHRECCLEMIWDANILAGSSGAGGIKPYLKVWLDLVKNNRRVRVWNHKCSYGEHFPIYHCKGLLILPPSGSDDAGPGCLIGSCNFTKPGGTDGRNLEAGVLIPHGTAQFQVELRRFRLERDYLICQETLWVINGKGSINNFTYQLRGDAKFVRDQKARADFYIKHQKEIDEFHSSSLEAGILYFRPLFPLGPSPDPNVVYKVPTADVVEGWIDEAVAGETIVFSSMNTQEFLVNRLVAAKERGVLVLVIISNFQSFPLKTIQPLLQAGIVALVGCPSLLHWKFVYTTKCGLWLGTANATIQAYNANLGEMLVHADPAYDHTFFHIVLKCINSLYPYELSMYLEGRGLLLPDPNKALEHSAASKLHVMSRLNGFQVYLNARGVDMRKAILSRLRG